ncbi:alkaline phosphatase family protein [Actinomycetospora chiangmaiensis]|uniref:alkaline phosphatase family protein n=1 Tax=Actinomycetospora chiangmaiensis TaxID=402650 RepID=UPI00039B441D|nr:alkaline phosphatase family protein [Actinomycetospora chiangmaiensis]
MPLPRPGRPHALAGLAVAAVAAVAAAVLPTLATPASAAPPAAAPRHVLLISVDGMHQSDLEGYVRRHPQSALASLVRAGTDYSQAATPVPSDSFPGMLGQVSGGTPRSTGVYYDSTYDRGLLPPGTTTCAGAKPGTDVVFDETIDRNPDALDAGQGLPGLPDSILAMTGQPRSLINPAKLPVDPTTCSPVYPHQDTRANTVFEVARSAGLHTAWSDKHVAYDLLDGPSGSGIDDLFAPEINSAAPGGGDWTTDNAATRRYDAYKVTAVRNEIDGFDHSRTTRPGTPAIFGLNFQSVSTAQKLPASDGLTGGYLADGVTPGPLLAGALDFVDGQLATMLAGLKDQHLDQSTTIILSAKHGQSPIDPALLDRIDDGPILQGLDTAWTAGHPGSGPLVVHSTDDDGMYLWLSDRSPVATSFAATYLRSHNGTGTDIAKNPRAYTSSGLGQILAGAEAAAYFHVPQSDSRVPDLVGIAQPGTVYTGGTKKIAEHGGALHDDRNVPLVVTGPSRGNALPSAHGGALVATPVSTTQIAPTILVALGLDPNRLTAVRTEGTTALPGR